MPFCVVRITAVLMQIDPNSAGRSLTRKALCDVGLASALGVAVAPLVPSM